MKRYALSLVRLTGSILVVSLLPLIAGSCTSTGVGADRARRPAPTIVSEGTLQPGLLMQRFARGAFYVLPDPDSTGDRVLTLDLQIGGWGGIRGGQLSAWLYQQSASGIPAADELQAVEPALDGLDIALPWSSVLLGGTDDRAALVGQDSGRVRAVATAPPSSMQLPLEGLGPAHLYLEFEAVDRTWAARTQLSFDAVTGAVADGGRFAIEWVEVEPYEGIVPIIGAKIDDEGEPLTDRPSVGGSIGFRRGGRGKKELYVPKGEEITVSTGIGEVDEIEFWVSDVYPPDGALPAWGPCHFEPLSPTKAVHGVSEFNKPSQAIVTNGPDVYAWLFVRISVDALDTDVYYKCGPFAVSEAEHELTAGADGNVHLIVGEPIYFE